MNLNLDRSKDGSTQVLPQFRDTKLGQIRLWTTTGSGTRPRFEKDWKTFVLYIIVNIVCLTTSIVLLVPLSLHTPGWIVFGVWGLLTLFGIVCVVQVFVRERSPNSKDDLLEMESMETKIDLPWKIPIDPVMDRAITYLVYHGQDDCENCRLLRFQDEFERRVKEWSKVGPPSDNGTFSYATVPTRTNHVTSLAGKSTSTQIYSGHSSTTEKDRPQTTMTSLPMKEHPIRRHASIISSDECDDTDTDDDIFDDVDNTNSNNNCIDSSRVTPRVIITPPDVTIKHRFEHSDGFVKSMTSSHPTTIDDVTTQLEHTYRKKATRRTGTSRAGPMSRHSSVSKRRRGAVQKSLQRMKDKSYSTENELRRANTSQKKSSTKLQDVMTSHRHPYDAIGEKKDVVVSVESSL